MIYVYILLILLTGCTSPKWCNSPTEPFDQDIVEVIIIDWLDLVVEITK